MITDPMETTELQAFVNVVEAGSVAAAARELNLPRATISRRLARLEERLESRLLHRTTRKQGLTDAGQELFRHARAILDAVGQAHSAIRRQDDVPRGVVRVSLPPADQFFRGMITEFLATYPEVRLEIDWSTRFVDLVGEGVDVALRAGRGALAEGLIARRLRRVDEYPVASVDYLERHGTPQTPEDLQEHQCLVGFAEGVRPLTHWPLRNGGRVRIQGRLVTNDLQTLAQVCAAGFGIALLPSAFATSSVEPGVLVPVLRDQVGAAGQLSVVYPEREFLPPAVRAFVDAMVDWFDRAPPDLLPLEP